MDSIKATSDFTIIDADMVSELLTSLCREARKQGLDFDDSSALDDTEYYRLTDSTKDQFNSLAQYLSGKMHSTKNHSKRVYLALLLTTLRMGLSNTILSTFLR